MGVMVGSILVGVKDAEDVHSMLVGQQATCIGKEAVLIRRVKENIVQGLKT